MVDVKAHKLKAAIKDQLHKKGLSYADLAEHLGCSVPTVKRILGSEELSINRLLEILELLDLSLSELEMLSSANEAKIHAFTAEQQEFLVKNRHFFAYLLKIYDKQTPKQIAEEFQLPQKSTDRYLIGLEKLGLIHVTGRQRIRPRYAGMPTLGNGVLAKTYYECFMRAVSEFFVKWVGDKIYSARPKDQPVKPGDQGLFSAQIGKMTAQSYEKLVRDVEKLQQDAVKTSAYEEKAEDPSRLKTAVFLAGTSYVPNDYKELKLLDNVLGPVTPI